MGGGEGAEGRSGASFGEADGIGAGGNSESGGVTVPSSLYAGIVTTSIATSRIGDGVLGESRRKGGSDAVGKSSKSSGSVS